MGESKMKRTFAIPLLGMLATILAPLATQAAVAVSLVWISTTGTGTPGSSTIEANSGDTLVAEVRIAPDAGGLTAYSMSVQFDTDLKDELDLVSATEFIPGVMTTSFTPGATGGFVDSTGAAAGEVATIEAVTLTLPGPTSGTLVAGELTFLVTNNVETDGDDVFTGTFNASTDGFGDNALTLITPTFSGAAVDLGPSLPSLSAPAGLAMLGLLATAGAIALRRFGTTR
jgi:hypothetical protein